MQVNWKLLNTSGIFENIFPHNVSINRELLTIKYIIRWVGGGRQGCNSVWNLNFPGIFFPIFSHWSRASKLYFPKLPLQSLVINVIGFGLRYYQNELSNINICFTAGFWHFNGCWGSNSSDKSSNPRGSVSNP